MTFTRYRTLSTKVALVFGMVVGLSPLLVEAANSEFVWLEGERPSSANIEVQRSGWGNTQFLSDGNWLHCSIEAGKVDGEVPDYDDFLAERRRLIALRIKEWFEVLS